MSIPYSNNGSGDAITIIQPRNLR